MVLDGGAGDPQQRGQDDQADHHEQRQSQKLQHRVGRVDGAVGVGDPRSVGEGDQSDGEQCRQTRTENKTCLLYTSDAADE